MTTKRTTLQRPESKERRPCRRLTAIERATILDALTREDNPASPTALADVFGVDITTIYRVKRALDIDVSRVMRAAALDPVEDWETARRIAAAPHSSASRLPRTACF